MNEEPKKWRRPRKIKIKGFEEIKGLGDIVEKIASPIAEVVDLIFDTNLKGCNSCAGRRDKLNKIFPIKKGDVNE